MANFKIVLIGPTSGKSSFVKRAIENIFNEQTVASPGIERETLKHQALLGGGNPHDLDPSHRDTLEIWDAASDDKSQALFKPYWRGSHAIVLMVDLSLFARRPDDEELYKHMTSLWTLLSKAHEELRKRNESPSIYLIGTKGDMLSGDNLQQAINNFNSFAANVHIQIAPECVFMTSAKQDFANHIENFEDFPKELCLQSPLSILRKINWDLKLKHSQSLNNSNAGPNLFSRFFGLMGGAVLGAATALLIHNPVACFLSAARAPYFAEWGHANWLRILLAPVVNPIMAVLYGLKDGAVFGAKNGVTELAQIPKNESFKLRTVIGSFLVSALIVAAGIAASPLLSLALPIVASIAAAAAVITITSMGVDLLMSLNELKAARKARISLLSNDTDDASQTIEIRQRKGKNKIFDWSLVNEYARTDSLRQKEKSYRSFRSYVNVAPRPPVTSAKEAEIANQTPQAHR